MCSMCAGFIFCSWGSLLKVHHGQCLTGMTKHYTGGLPPGSACDRAKPPHGKAQGSASRWQSKSGPFLLHCPTTTPLFLDFSSDWPMPLSLGSRMPPRGVLLVEPFVKWNPTSRWTSPHTSKQQRARAVQAQLKHVMSCEAHCLGSVSLLLDTQSRYLGLIHLL